MTPAPEKLRTQLRGRAGVVILMIDHIGGRHVAIRRKDDGLVIRLLDRPGELQLDGGEWIELVGLVVAIKAAMEFQEG